LELRGVAQGGLDVSIAVSVEDTLGGEGKQALPGALRVFLSPTFGRVQASILLDVVQPRADQAQEVPLFAWCRGTALAAATHDAVLLAVVTGVAHQPLAQTHFQPLDQEVHPNSGFQSRQ